MTTNAELAGRYSSVFPAWQRTLYAEPVSIDRGEGGYVWDVEGTRYLDFFGGVLTTMIGYNHPEVTAAIAAQASKVNHTSTLFLSEPMITLAEEIAAVSGIPDAKVYFTASGSEANDTAVMLATAYRKSNQVLAIRNSYHGRSFTNQAITSHAGWTNTTHHGLDVHFVQGGYRLRSPFRQLDDASYIDACVADLEQILDMTDGGSVAALIAEPIQGVGGFATPPDGLFGAMQKSLSNRGILYISDEVQTGWGRTGEHFWGYQAHGVVPDILTFAKGIGNGTALAGVVARAEIMDVLTRTSFATFGGTPLVCAAGLATLRHVRAHDLQGNALRMGERLRAALEPAVEDSPFVAEFRGKGLMLAVETVQPGSLEPDPAAAAEIMEGAKRRGLLVGKGGLYGNALRIAPMLNVTEAEIDEGAAALVGAINDLSQETP